MSSLGGGNCNSQPLPRIFPGVFPEVFPAAPRLCVCRIVALTPLAEMPFPDLHRPAVREMLCCQRAAYSNNRQIVPHGANGRHCPAPQHSRQSRGSSPGHSWRAHPRDLETNGFFFVIWLPPMSDKTPWPRWSEGWIDQRPGTSFPGTAFSSLQLPPQ